MDPQHRFTVQHIHLHRGLELAQMGFGFPALPVDRGHVHRAVVLRIKQRGHHNDLARAKPALGHVIAEFAHYQRWRQGLQGVGTKPGGTGAGLEPFDQLVVCAEGTEPP